MAKSGKTIAARNRNIAAQQAAINQQQALTAQYYQPPSNAYSTPFTTSYNTGPSPYAVDAYGAVYGTDITAPTAVSSSSTGAKSGATQAATKLANQKALFFKGLLIVGTVIGLIYVTKRFNLLSGGR